MTDFVYTARACDEKEMAAAFAVMSPSAARDIGYFSGEWGTLGVGRTPYRGYEPYEDDRHLCVVLGGPVLYFRDNSFLSGGAAGEGTRAVLDGWRSSIRWDEDLSGPFAALIVDKQRREIMVITDLMLFIPVFAYGSGADFSLASHVGVLAAVCGQASAFDPVALAEFVLHGHVTYPHTAYKAIRQLSPAAEHQWRGTGGPTTKPYWQPAPDNRFANIGQAASYLRKGFSEYIERITGSMEHVAQFISGGEDSRVLSGALPARLKRDAYIFLDGMNREGEIAAKVARAYGAEFRPDFRSQTHYLDILPNAAALAGCGYQYRHGHILGFHERHRLYDYPAVFGGYYSDTLLKALCVRLTPLTDRFDFLPQRVLPGETRSVAVSHPLFPSALTDEIAARSRAHLEWVSQQRSTNLHEWFALWPSTMRASITNLHFNRRLCASFEPFLCKEVVKVCAAAPLDWKLNRRLFLLAFRPFLKKTRWYRHGDGRLPYFPWWINSPIRFSAWLSRAVVRRLTKDTRNQGPWCDWDAMARSPEYLAALASLSKSCQNSEIADLLRPCAAYPEKLTAVQKVNLMQTCYLIAAADDGQVRHGRDRGTSVISREDLEFNL